MKDKKGPVKTILILSANPVGTARLRLDEEVREIQEGLKRSKHRDQFNICQKWAVQRRDLRRALLEHEPQILHFTGHGESEGILVEDKQGFGTLVPPRALAGLFKLHSDRIECVILNACYSDHQARTINKHIRYVIGMPRQIKDKAAIEFAVGFYDALGAGKPVEEAFAFGCNAIQQYWPEIPESIYPILHTNPRIRIKKKRPYLVPVLIAFMLLVAFFIGLQWKNKSEKTVTTDTKSEKAVTTETASPDRDVTLPGESPGDDPWVYITRTGRKYHKEGCRYLSKSKIPIKLSKAKEQGYTPCSVCKPP
jgi:hypothetical protein